MLKKLYRFGNRRCLEIPAAILKLLDWDINEVVKITTDGRRLILEPTGLQTDHKLKDLDNGAPCDEVGE